MGLSVVLYSVVKCSIMECSAVVAPVLEAGSLALGPRDTGSDPTLTTRSHCQLLELGLGAGGETGEGARVGEGTKKEDI